MKSGSDGVRCPFCRGVVVDKVCTVFNVLFAGRLTASADHSFPELNGVFGVRVIGGSLFGQRRI